MGLFEVFQETCKNYSSKTALIEHAGGKVYSYETLFQDTCRIINRLAIHKAIRPGDRIGFLLQNEPAFVHSFFAVQALGGIVVPLSTRLTREELGVIIKDCAMRGLISSPEFSETYSGITDSLAWSLTPETLPVDIVPGEPASYPAQPTDLAVLVYTSGTTGKPKGVMLSHENLLEDTRINGLAIEVTSQDVFITTSPLFHVFGLTNIMLTSLLHGASLVLLKRFQPKGTLEAVSQHRVSFLAAVPTMYQMMLSLLPNPDYDFTSLRVCHSGAAPMPQAVFEAVEKQFAVPVQEGYGQSEASSIMTSNPLHGLRKPGSVGKALDGLTVEIVDAHDHSVSSGAIGELRLKGKTVMAGYWNNIEATRKAIRDGWLYTSDMGYFDEDGYIFLKGRRDDMINVAGSKVYPQEVEEVLYRHPSVESCAVTPELSDLYYQAVVAYVVLRPDMDVSALALQRFCSQHLADYKVPKSINFVTEIPKGPSGKILRHHLGRS